VQGETIDGRLTPPIQRGEGGFVLSFLIDNSKAPHGYNPALEIFHGVSDIEDSALQLDLKFAIVLAYGLKGRYDGSTLTLISLARHRRRRIL